MVLLFILQVPLAAALGVLIFLGSFIPLVGLTVTGALCVAVAGLAHGLTAAIVVAVAIIVLVQVEANVLQPLIMSRSVEVHPLAIALAVVTGTLLGGIVGALLAVPLVAFLNSTISALRHGAASIVVAERMPRRSLLRRAARESAAGGPPGPATTAVSADAERPSGLILPGTDPPAGGDQPPGGSADV
jgi:hypothetical protein